MVLFFSNILAPYRIGLYNKIAELLNGNIKYFFDSNEEPNRKWKIDKNKINFTYEVKNSFYFRTKSKISNETILERFIYFPFHILPTILKEKPDTILTAEFGLRTLFAIIGGRLVKAKVFVLSEVTGFTELNISPFKYKFRKLLVKYLEGGIAHGKNSLEYLKKLGFENHKIIISPDAVDNEFFINLKEKISKTEARMKLGFSENDFVFLYVGQFIQRKGLDLLNYAFNELVSMNDSVEIKLVLVGGTKTELKNLVNEEINENINVYDFVEGEELFRFLRAADCFILPTRSDVWGLVVNEAVACGLPVAVSKYAGCANDLIENKISGIVFDPVDRKSFQETLKFCMENPEQLVRYAKNAAQRLEEFNHSVAAQKIVSFIK